MSIDLSADTQRWLARAPALLNVLLVLAIGLAAARLFWLLWPQSARAIQLTAQPAAIGSASDRPHYSMATITGANLFGVAQDKASATSAKQHIEAPETHLNLSLTGIISNRSGHRSRALIENGKGKQNSYAVGDSIRSGVVVHDIYVTRVILERAGRYETLTLESIKQARKLKRAVQQVAMTDAGRGDTTTGDDNNAAGPPRAGDSGDTQQTLGAIRDQILADPAHAERYIRLQPARDNGKLIGYSIYPGPQRGLFEQTGLQAGAIVTAINGQQLNNSAQALQLLSQLADAPSATFTLQHNGRQRTVTMRFE